MFPPKAPRQGQILPRRDCRKTASLGFSRQFGSGLRAGFTDFLRKIGGSRCFFPAHVREKTSHRKKPADLQAFSTSWPRQGQILPRCFLSKKARKNLRFSGKETVFSGGRGLYKQGKIRYNINGLVGLPPNDRKYKYKLEETSGKSALRGGTDGINQRPPAAGEHLR